LNTVKIRGRHRRQASVAACTTEGCAFRHKSDTNSYFTCSWYRFLSHYKYEVLDKTTLQVCTLTSSVPAIWRLLHMKLDNLTIKDKHFLYRLHIAPFP
jgi:hypothetical protein